MRILLIAYACRPDRGSEPGVGWNWALAAARLGHDVSVITRAEGRDAIEHAQRVSAEAGRLTFIYIDDRSAVEKYFHRGGVLVINKLILYHRHRRWQKTAAQKAKKLCHARKRAFDLIHAVTIRGILFPSFSKVDGVPLIVGPLGGGDTTPWRLIWSLPLHGILTEITRRASLATLTINPDMLRTFRNATAIAVSSPEAATWVPRRWRKKTFVHLGMGSNSVLMADDRCEPARTPDRRFRVLFVGRFIYLKGMDLGFPAFGQLAGSRPGVELTMIGDGPEASRWRQVVTQLGVADKVTWSSWLPREEVLQAYAEHDVLLFPSLHDSAPWVVFEALAAGLPVVCFNLGGLSQIVTDDCGVVVDAKSGGTQKVIDALARGLFLLHDDSATREVMQTNARRRAAAFTWERAVEDIYGRLTSWSSPSHSASAQCLGQRLHTWKADPKEFELCQLPLMPSRMPGSEKTPPM